MSLRSIFCGVLGISLAALGASQASAQGAYQDMHTGRGTFYGYDGGGNCSLPMPSNVLTAAMNESDYNTAQACGAYIEVTNLNTAQSVVVRIDNRCPECAKGSVDLAQPAFEQISPREAGIIPISWKYVSGPSSSVSVYFKEGSSQWWTGIQVREHRNPVASLAYRASGSGAEYVALGREMYNYFIAPSGMGPGPYDLRITDVFGQVIEATGVHLQVSTEIALGMQFPEVLPAAGASPSSSGNSSASNNSGSSAAPPPPAAASAADTQVSGVSNWGQGYCNNVTVHNPNTAPLNWSVTLPVEGSIYTHWNAHLAQQGASMTGRGVDWNQTLAPGASTQFGYCANR